MIENIAIQIKGISKKYKIGATKADSLKDTISNSSRRLIGGKGKSKDFWALNNISIDVPKGKVLGIIGKNGAGKSTLLKILSRITKPSAGSIEINGRVSSLLEVGTGFHPELTGRENIFLNATILGMSRKEVKEKFDAIVEFAGIGKFIDTPVKHYSSGMYVRLAFSVAGNLEPEILIIDEVLAVGDADFQRKCLGKMSEVSQNEGRTVIFVSHNMGAIKGLCDEVVYLKNGNIEAIGSAEEMTNMYLEDNLRKYTDVEMEVPENERAGTGKVRIKSVRFISSETKLPIDTVFCGQEGLIEIGYKANSLEDLNGFDIRMNVVDSNKQFHSQFSIELWGKQIAPIPKQGKIYCKIPKIPFSHGEFYLVVNALVNRELADNFVPCRFTVVQADFFGNGGRKPSGSPQGVYVHHEWYLA